MFVAGERAYMFRRERHFVTWGAPMSQVSVLIMGVTKWIDALSVQLRGEPTCLTTIISQIVDLWSVEN